jgi:hypothetical protein
MEMEPAEGQSQEQPIILDNQPLIRRFTAGANIALPSAGAIDFRPVPSSQGTTDSNQSRADKARARTAKAREARARKIAERKAASSDDDDAGKAKKTARVVDLIGIASQGRTESELSSELSSALGVVNMSDLERQLDAHKALTALSGHQNDSDEDFEPSPDRLRKRKQPHGDSEDMSLTMRMSGKRRTYSRTSSRSTRQ